MPTKSECNAWAVDVADHYQREISRWIQQNIVALDPAANFTHFNMFDREFYVPNANVKLIHRLHKLQQAWNHALCEQYTMQEPRHAYYFAVQCLGTRWHAAEKFIQADPFWWNKYVKAFSII